MRQRVDPARLYRRALHAMPETVKNQSQLPVPAGCPLTLDELLADSRDPATGSALEQHSAQRAPALELGGKVEPRMGRARRRQGEIGERRTAAKMAIVEASRP
jgi:hypothetical protein